MQFSTQKLSLATSFILLVALSGCGGGGSNGSAATSSPPSGLPVAGTVFPIQPAVAAFYTAGFQKTITAPGTYLDNSVNDSLDTYVPGQVSILFTVTPSNPNSTFAGQASVESTVSAMGTAGTNPVANTEQQYLTTNYTPIGDVANSFYCVTQSSTPLPATASEGSAGTLATMACYSDSTMATPTGSYRFAWGLVQGTTPTTAVLTLSEVFSNTAGIQTSGRNTIFTVNTAGNLSFTSLFLDNGTYNFTAQ